MNNSIVDDKALGERFRKTFLFGVEYWTEVKDGAWTDWTDWIKLSEIGRMVGVDDYETISSKAIFSPFRCCFIKTEAHYPSGLVFWLVEKMSGSPATDHILFAAYARAGAFDKTLQKILAKPVEPDKDQAPEHTKIAKHGVEYYQTVKGENYIKLDDIADVFAGSGIENVRHSIIGSVAYNRPIAIDGSSYYPAKVMFWLTDTCGNWCIVDRKLFAAFAQAGAFAETVAGWQESREKVKPEYTVMTVDDIDIWIDGDRNKYIDIDSLKFLLCTDFDTPYRAETIRKYQEATHGLINIEIITDNVLLLDFSKIIALAEAGVFKKDN